MATQNERGPIILPCFPPARTDGRGFSILNALTKPWRGRIKPPIVVLLPRPSALFCLLHVLPIFVFVPAAAVGQPVGSFNWANADELYASVRHAHLTTDSPRLLSMHALRIDLDNPAIRFTTTGRIADWEADSRETLSERTRDFVTRLQGTDRRAVAAINANWYGLTSQSAVPVDLNGLAVSEGVLVSPPWNNQRAFVIRDDGTPDIVATSTTMDLDGIEQAVSGYVAVLVNGNPNGHNTDITSRTVIGMSRDRRYVVMLVIDGRRPGHSLGATDRESGQWLRYFGAWNGINLDGGGSSTMAWWNPAENRAEIFNIPTVPFLGFPVTFERHVGNNIGVYFREEPEADGYAAWAGALGLSGSDADPEADLSGDGWANLFAYLFNFDPRLPIDAAPGHAVPRFGHHRAGGEAFLEVEFRRNPAAENVLLSVEIATDLGGDWSPVANSVVEDLAPDPVTGDPRWRIRVDTTVHARAFIRLRAHRAPDSPD